MNIMVHSNDMNDANGGNEDELILRIRTTTNRKDEQGSDNLGNAQEE